MRTLTKYLSKILVWETVHHHKNDNLYQIATLNGVSSYSQSVNLEYGQISTDWHFWYYLSSSSSSFNTWPSPYFWFQEEKNNKSKKKKTWIGGKKMKGFVLLRIFLGIIYFFSFFVWQTFRIWQIRLVSIWPLIPKGLTNRQSILHCKLVLFFWDPRFWNRICLTKKYIQSAYATILCLI